MGDEGSIGVAVKPRKEVNRVKQRTDKPKNKSQRGCVSKLKKKRFGNGRKSWRKAAMDGKNKKKEKQKRKEGVEGARDKIQE